MIARWSLLTEPWWARASSGDAPELVPEAPGMRGRLCGHELGNGGRKHPLGVQLIEPPREPLGQAARVHEDDGRPVLEDQVDDALLDVRPDRALRAGSRRGAVELGRRAEFAHVVDGHDHPQVETSSSTAERRS